MLVQILSPVPWTPYFTPNNRLPELSRKSYTSNDRIAIAIIIVIINLPPVTRLRGSRTAEIRPPFFLVYNTEYPKIEDRLGIKKTLKTLTSLRNIKRPIDVGGVEVPVHGEGRAGRRGRVPGTVPVRF